MLLLKVLHGTLDGNKESLFLRVYGKTLDCLMDRKYIVCHYLLTPISNTSFFSRSPLSHTIKNEGDMHWYQAPKMTKEAQWKMSIWHVHYNLVMIGLCEENSEIYLKIWPFFSQISLNFTYSSHIKLVYAFWGPEISISHLDFYCDFLSRVKAHFLCHLYPMEESKSYGFGTTCGWVNNEFLFSGELYTDNVPKASTFVKIPLLSTIIQASSVKIVR